MAASLAALNWSILIMVGVLVGSVEVLQRRNAALHNSTCYADPECRQGVWPTILVHCTIRRRAPQKALRHKGLGPGSRSGAGSWRGRSGVSGWAGKAPAC